VSISRFLPILGSLAVLAFGLAAVGTWVMRSIAPQFGLLDQPGERKIHTQPTPRGGGIAIFVALWLPIVLAVAVTHLPTSCTTWLPAWSVPFLPGIAHRLPRIASIFAGSLLLAIIGLIDDRRGVPGWLRLLATIIVATLLFAFKQERITIFLQNPWLTGVLTVAWIVGVTCTFMVLDNMDGLCGGVAFIVGLMFVVVALQTQQLFLAAVFALLVGAVGGFLVFNFPPASIFMGDCGSMFIGFMIGVLSVDFTFYQPTHPLFPVVVPLLILAVPIFDIVSVTWIRLSEGRSPFSADTKHFSHRLLALGMTQRQAVLTIYLVTAAIGLGATVLYQSTTVGAVVAIVQAAAVFAIIVVLERAGLSRERRRP